jgi:hypothetical protein
MRAHGLALPSVDVKLGKTRRIVDKNKANILAVQTAATQLSQRVDALKATVDANDNNAQTQARTVAARGGVCKFRSLICVGACSSAVTRRTSTRSTRTSRTCARRLCLRRPASTARSPTPTRALLQRLLLSIPR